MYHALQATHIHISYITSKLSYIILYHALQATHIHKNTSHPNQANYMPVAKFNIANLNKNAEEFVGYQSKICTDFSFL